MNSNDIKEFNLSIVGIKKSLLAQNMNTFPEDVQRPKQMSSQIKENLR